jgi:MFS family permease
LFTTRLWQHGPFVRFFVGASLSIVGTWCNTVAIAVLTYQLTGQVSLVAVTIAASVLPRVLLAPIGGALADRFERRSVLVALDCACAVMALLPLLVHRSSSIWLIYVAVVLLQAGACVYNPAQGAYLPNLVPDDLLEPANAAYAVMGDLGMFVGPALATGLLSLWGPTAAFGGNALTFVISAGLLLTLPHGMHGSRRAVRVRALVSGYAAIVRRHPRVGALYLCYLACAAPVYFFLAIMVVYAQTLGQPATFIGARYAAAGLGGALGGLGMGQYLRRLPYPVAITLYALSLPLLGALVFVHHPGPAVVLWACSMAAGTAGDVIFSVNVQRYVPAEERGRAFGMLFWCIAIGQLIGASLGAAVTARTAMPVLLWVSMAGFPIVIAGVLLSIRARPPAGLAAVGAMAKGT